MKKKNPTYKIFLSTSIIVILTALMIGLIIFPTINYIKKIKLDIQTIENESADQYQKIKLLKKSISELKTVQEKSKELEKGLVEKDNAIKLIQDLENLAIEKNVEQSLSISSGEGESFVFSFNIKTSFYKAVQYLHSLEHLPFYVVIDNLSWSRIDENNISLSFKATIFTK